MTMSAQETRALEELCRIYDIRLAVVASNPEHALVVLTALYSHLSIEDEYERRQHRDSILRETDRVWGQTKFFHRVNQNIAMMIAQPRWFGSSRSNTELTQEFNNLVKVVFIMEVLGVSTLVPMAYRSTAKGVEELIKESSIRKGIEAAKRRLIVGAGSGIVEAAAVRMGMAVGPWAMVAAGLLVVTYFRMLDRLEAIRAEMELRVNLGQATQQELDQLRNENFMTIIEQALEAYW